MKGTDVSDISKIKDSFNIIGIGEVLWDVFPDGPRFGGAPANLACAIAGLLNNTSKVTMVSALGNDELGRKAIDSLKQRNVNINHVQSNDFYTGTVTVSLDKSLQASYQFAKNCAWDNIEWSESWAKLAAETDAVCFGSLAQRSNISRNAIHSFINAVPDTSLKVLDINLRAPYYCDEVIIQSLELANVLKLNEEELPLIANLLSMKGDINSLLKQIQKRFKLNTVALTQGVKGATLIHFSEQVEVPIVPTTVVDTVGAGDSFTAALTLGLLQQKPLREVGEFAAKVSSYVCSKRGGTPRLTQSLFI